MSAMTAREFFEGNQGNSEYCKVLQSLPAETQIAWESERSSVYSPGIVKDSESLCRQVLDPIHFDSVTGTIKPTFFDDASNKGASCHRMEHTTEIEIKKIAQARVEEANVNPPSTGLRTLIGYARIAVGAIRCVVTSIEPRRRALAVYDTAKETDQSHADICQLVPSGKREGKSVRAQLFQAAKDNLVRF